MFRLNSPLPVQEHVVTTRRGDFKRALGHALPDDIGIEGKRLVNLSVIALAQELFLVFSEHDVARR